jgi:transposase
MIPQSSMCVYLALGSTDMRKAINGLSILVEQAMGLNPFSGDSFAMGHGVGPQQHIEKLRKEV